MRASRLAFRLRTRPVRTWLVAAAVIAAIVVVAAVSGGTPFGVDRALHELIGEPGTGPARRIATGVDLLGAGPVLYPLLSVTCVVGYLRRRTVRELLPVVVLAACQVAQQLLFATWHRPPPSDEIGSLLAIPFTSGHTTTAVVGWGLIAWQAGRLGWLPPALVGWVRWGVAPLLGALVGAARVYLGLRWASDVAAGVVVGSAFLAAATAGLAWLRGPQAAGPREPAEPAEPAGTAEPAVPASADRRAGPVVVRVGRWLRMSRWAWAVPAVAALVPVAPVLAAPPAERLKDMLVYHGATRVAGVGENLYAYQTVFAMPFTYPPFAAMVLEPIARMPLGVAQTLWTVATLAAVVGLAATVLRPVADRIGMPLTVAAVLLTTAVRSHVRFGQVGLFLVLLVGLDLLRRRRGRWVGWGLGLATAIKLTPAVFLPWLALTRQWRRLTGTLLWLGGATLAGLLLLWPSAGAYLLRAAWDTGRFGANDIPGNQSVRGMLLRTMPEAAAERGWLVAAVLLAAAGTYQAWRCERYGNRLAAVGVLAAMSVAVSPISWVHHLVWLALPIAALAAAGRLRWVAGWYAVLAVSPLLLTNLAGRLPLPPVLAAPVTELAGDLPGLSAVAAVFALPALVGVRSRGATGSRGAPPGQPARARGSSAASARNAWPRWLTASFSSGVSSALVRVCPWPTKIGS